MKLNMKNPQKIQKMFDDIASNYDFMNNIISLGLHNFVKKIAISKINFKNKLKALDLCCGTGDVSRILSEQDEVESIIGVDFSQNMTELANKKNSSKKIKYINEDCTKLPFEDNSFDIITMFFGLRNIDNTTSALNEVKRVLSESGEFLYMDFDKSNKILNIFYDIYVKCVIKIFNKNKSAYEYLLKSKKEFWNTDETIQKFFDSGLKLKRQYKLLFSMILVQIYQK